MKTIKFITVFILASIFQLNSQTILSGLVLDDETNLPIEGVNVVNQNNNKNTTTNHSGLFQIPIENGQNEIVFFRIGYKSSKNNILKENEIMYLEIKLKPSLISTGEITVTSTRYQKLEKEVALPLEVISEDKIEKNLSLSVPDALNSEPGITLVRDGIWGTDINIRGLSRQNVVTLIDGNRIETATNHAAGLSLIDMFEVERVEVIKGGVSSLYGTGATGGVVNVSTKKIYFTDKFRLSGSLSSGYNSVNKGGIGNIFLSGSSSTWYVKLNGTLRSASNTNTPNGLLPNSFFRDNYFSTVFAFRPSENHDIKVNYQKFDGREIGIPGGKTFPTTASAKYLIAKRELYSFEYSIKNLFPSLVESSIKYFFQGIERSVELKPNSTTTTLPRANHNTNGIQLNTNWLVNNNNQLAAGIDYWQRNYRGFREAIVKSGTTLKITADYPVPNSEYRSIGFYAQNESKLIQNKLTLTVGGRYDLIKVTNADTKNPAYIITNGVINNNPPKNVLGSFAKGTYNDKSWSGNISMLYSLLNNLDVTINFAHAFRSPVLEERFQYINLGGDIYLGNPNLKSEVGNFLDAGLRLWEDKLSLKINFFLNTFQDLVVDKVVIKDSLYQKDNIGKARFIGFDLGLEYIVIDAVSIFSSVSFVEGRDTDKKTFLSQVPPMNGKLGVKTSLLKYADFEAAATFFTRQNKIGQGELPTPGYVLLDFYFSSMAIDYGLISFKLFAGLENVFDKSYRNHLSTNRGLIVQEPGRNAFIKIKLSW
jgi:hemoglobin/transferrin/lactoferrin receptor protein